MLQRKTMLHFGEHSGGHEHAHEHACHHEHSHADELHNIAHALEAQGKHEAANLVGDAVHYFGHCNDKLEEALRLVKGGE